MHEFAFVWLENRTMLFRSDFASLQSAFKPDLGISWVPSKAEYVCIINEANYGYAFVLFYYGIKYRDIDDK